MDALDMQILRELGMEPFVGWTRRPHGLRTSEVARKLGLGVHLVKDRIARMTRDGVIIGYRVMPNLRHFGQQLTVHHFQSATVPDQAGTARLANVDGFDRIVWFLDSGLCVNLSHGSRAERDRRVDLIRQLVGYEGPAKVLYEIDFPKVERTFTDLDWRVIRAMEPDAKRPLSEVADELGVTTKTVRTRLNRMREEGSIDEYAVLDLSKVEGVIPFQVAAWFEDGADPTKDLMEAFEDRYLAHFTPPKEDGFSTFSVRIFAYTAAEVQALVRDALDVPGVKRAEAMVATGGWANERWISELLEAHAPASVPIS